MIYSTVVKWPFSVDKLRDRSRRPGGWMGADQNFFRNSNRRHISRKSPKPSSILAKVWNSYGKAKPTQKVSNERAKTQSKSEANRGNCRTDLPGPVWPVYWTGLTGRGCSKSSKPVWPVLPTGLTGGTQKTLKIFDSNGESRPNDHENRWNLGDCFAPTPWTYPQKISS